MRDRGKQYQIPNLRYQPGDIAPVQRSVVCVSTTINQFCEKCADTCAAALTRTESTYPFLLHSTLFDFQEETGISVVVLGLSLSRRRKKKTHIGRPRQQKEREGRS